MEIVIPIVTAVVGIVAGAGGIFAYNKRNENGGKNKADDLIRKAKHEASEIVLNAKKEASRLTEKNQAEENDRRKEWKQTEKRLAERETTLDAKLDQLEKYYMMLFQYLITLRTMILKNTLKICFFDKLIFKKT